MKIATVYDLRDSIEELPEAWVQKIHEFLKKEPDNDVEDLAFLVISARRALSKRIAKGLAGNLACLYPADVENQYGYIVCY